MARRRYHHTCGVKDSRECRLLHKIFGERWPGRPTCTTEAATCPIRRRLLQGHQWEPDPIIVDRLARTRALRRVTRLKPNTLGVPPSLCPIYNVKIYVPCQRRSCLLHVDNLPYYLNCGFRFAETVATRGWTPHRSLSRLAAATGEPQRHLRARLKRLLVQLARFYFRDYLATHREAYQRRLRACCFCYSTDRGVYYSERWNLFVCFRCAPLPPRVHRALKQLEATYQTSAAVVYAVAHELFHGQRALIQQVLELPSAAVEELSSRLRSVLGSTSV